MVILTSCGRTIPKGATAVKPFDVKRYTGTWYEIARLDFKQERGLNNTSAEYAIKDDGTISVLNRGFDFKEKKWKEAKGKAKFVDDRSFARAMARSRCAFAFLVSVRTSSTPRRFNVRIEAVSRGCFFSTSSKLSIESRF